MSTSHEDHLKKMLNKLQRRLWILKERNAVQGYDTKPETIIEIEEIEIEIKETKEELTLLANIPSYIDNTQLRIYLNQVEKGIEPYIDNVEDIFGYERELFTNDGVKVTEEFQKFIGPTSSLQILVIRGHAGCGKSVYLHDQARRLATDLLFELEHSTEHIDFENPIPIFLSLRNFSIKSGYSFEWQILRDLRGPTLLNLSDNVEIEHLFEDWNKGWVIFLDGLDEITKERRNNLWEEIKRVAKFPNIKLVLTCRPDTKLDSSKGIIREINIALFTESQIKQYLDIRIESDKRINDAILRLLTQNDDLWEHLQIPLLLKITGDYFYKIKLIQSKINETLQNKLPTSEDDENDNTDELSISFFSKRTNILSQKNEIDEVETYEESSSKSVSQNTQPTEAYSTKEVDYLAQYQTKNIDLEKSLVNLGEFLNILFDELWKHNEKKIAAGMDLDKDRMYECLGRMAAEKMVGTDKITRQIAKFYLENGLLWMLDLGVLREYRARIHFPTKLSKINFVTFFLLILLEDDSPNLELIQGPPDFWKHCLQLVQDLAPKYENVDINLLEKQIAMLEGV